MTSRPDGVDAAMRDAGLGDLVNIGTLGFPGPRRAIYLSRNEAPGGVYAFLLVGAMECVSHAYCDAITSFELLSRAQDAEG